MQRGAVTEISYQRLNEVKLCQLVSLALQEQHWNSDFLEVLTSICRGLASGVKRKTEKYQTMHAQQRRRRLCL